ncbi:hypothetical protein LPJ78_005491 [Coemansia sp. RSA 989]|nr:putative polysaccharide biosynthesis protein [Coemansia mojavensis]KAJ1738726.1 hypothetical protein LPJ68_005311 [Coemansia sp. RSA 1086]KAJ1747146.1 hypothetical protein LPJ79_005452 [Coemansia sp. RSA 1821]KAJ1861176.1 hypothetical protein LPJ78_005491 [Coemansia sp. RSA 989]KAJ1869187.1 hypothetical protein LPJ55_005527 [Coemansia sp. RSA 990]KAJ2630529.1 hypothetical protein H4R22_002605 [Coemansia sp. RSA 1290]KAJ2645930.1 hypothetical protein IWW40_005779 [Coemansia sp. RSA 1250]KA
MALPRAEDTGNMVEMEMQWAVKAMHHAETYMKLLKAVGPGNFRLCPIEDELYEDFRKNFPDLKIDVLNEEDFKSEMSKAKWREFMNKYEHSIKDYNFGSLLRIDCTGDYTEENTMFAMRTQFLCIEIARNKEGLNKI